MFIEVNIYMGIYNYNQKEIILSSAKQIALEQGITKINIRLVAQKSDISIGTVYNYYPTKADLLVAVIEDFWSEAFEKINFKTLEGKNFYDRIQEVYDNLYTYLNTFKDNWLEQISLLNAREKKLGRKKEEEYFAKICTIIISFMDSDESISDKVWGDCISKEKTAEFIFDNMLLMLKKDESNLEFFIAILKKIMSN